ncbi:MAG: ATP-binding protein [Coriobacteriia bacterium]|nr:ATP-binding protein [Coriobacteriia bacterium]
MNLHAQIADTGMGMTPEFMETIFEQFSRAVDTRVNTIQGTGLGLAIVKQIVTLMNGTIEVASQPNQGSTFEVVLPLEVDESPAEDPSPAHAPIDQERLQGLRVLIAEDNDLNYEIAQELLSDYGMAIDRAVDGAEAVDKVSQSEPSTYDLVLMDMQMPNMNGHVAKPLNIKLLLQTMQAVLN